MKNFMTGIVVILLVAANVVQFVSYHRLAEGREAKIDQQSMLIKGAADQRGSLLESVHSLQRQRDEAMEAGGQLFQAYQELLQQYNVVRAQLQRLMSIKLA